MSRIADHRIRAAVWYGIQTGNWHVDMYFARRRSTSPVLYRAVTDRDMRTAPIERTFATRLEALNYAHRTVGSIRHAATAAVAGLEEDPHA